MIGTLINAAAIAVGSLIGMQIRSRLPARIVDTVFQGIGLFTLAIGIALSLRAHNLTVAVVSIAAGTVIGQAIDIDRHLRRLSDYLQRKSQRCPDTGDRNPDENSGDHTEPGKTLKAGGNRFTEGFVTATMLFCVGSMSILGPIEDGLGEVPHILYTKSILDGISSVALATTFGAAILLSSVPVLIYQGAVTLLAAFMARFMSEAMIADLTGVGGILLIGLGINILRIAEIKVSNMLPALIVAVALSYFWS